MLLIAGCATQPIPDTRPVIHRPAADREPSLELPLPLAQGLPEGPGEPYFDPNRTGVPLFDLQGHAATRLGRWFRAGEFARMDHAPARYVRIDARLVRCLARIREATGEPMEILSAYRSWAHNERIRKAGQGAAKSSFHISGSAADVVTSTPAEQFAVAVYLECGCNAGLGVSPRFYHVDIRTYPVQPWGYGASEAPRLALARKVQRNVCGI
jgi:hypothetical protein